MEHVLREDREFNRLAKAQQKRIRDEIAEARANGFLALESELTEGVADIAVPVGVDGSGTAAVLAVSYLNSGANAAQRRQSYLKAALLHAEEINRDLGVFG